MLIALVLFNVLHPGQVMPGKEGDFPSRKQRKAIGKENVRGRMANYLPLYEQSGVQLTEMDPTHPKNDNTTVTYGSVREFES